MLPSPPCKGGPTSYSSRMESTLRLYRAALTAELLQRFEKLLGHGEQKEAPDDSSITPEAIEMLEPDEPRGTEDTEYRQCKKQGRDVREKHPVPAYVNLCMQFADEDIGDGRNAARPECLQDKNEKEAPGLNIHGQAVASAEPDLAIPCDLRPRDQKISDDEHGPSEDLGKILQAFHIRELGHQIRHAKSAHAAMRATGDQAGAAGSLHVVQRHRHAINVIARTALCDGKNALALWAAHQVPEACDLPAVEVAIGDSLA